MIVIKPGENEVLMNLAFKNEAENYLLNISDPFNQYSIELQMVDMSPNKNLFTMFNLEVVEDVNDQDLSTNKIFIKKEKRYIYRLTNQENETIDVGYLICI